jgi:hypothetical protein
VIKTLVVGLVLSSAAWAHGDAEWIQRGRFTGIDGSACCGPDDCETAPADAVVRIKGGWKIVQSGQVFLDGHKGTYESINLEFWWCRFPNQPGLEGKRRCLFAPRLGT